MTKCIGWLSIGVIVIGLAVTGLGAWWTAKAVIIDDKTASELAATKWNGNEALKQALIDQSRSARFGLILIVVGTGLQIVGTIGQALTGSST